MAGRKWAGIRIKTGMATGQTDRQTDMQTASQTDTRTGLKLKCPSYNFAKLKSRNFVNEEKTDNFFGSKSLVYARKFFF
jgi:hypothetical protein